LDKFGKSFGKVLCALGKFRQNYKMALKGQSTLAGSERAQNIEK